MAESDKSFEYIYAVSMDIDASRESLFNEVYNSEQIPNLSKVPGVLNIARYESIAFDRWVNGRLEHITDVAPRYTALYGLSSANIVSSAHWDSASELGRWSGEVRPYTLNRTHRLWRRLEA